MRTLVNKTKELIEKGDKVLAQESFTKTSKILDKGAKNNVIHKNKAARHKSQLAKQINELKGKKASTKKKTKASKTKAK